MLRTLTVKQESWPIRGSFRISRGAKTTADVVVVEITENGITGRGECVPYRRYGETPSTVLGQVTTARDAIAHGASRVDLLSLLPSGRLATLLTALFGIWKPKRQAAPLLILLIFQSQGLSSLPTHFLLIRLKKWLKRRKQMQTAPS